MRILQQDGRSIDGKSEDISEGGLLVIDKPPLVAVHPTARYHKNTVIKRLNQQRPGEWLSLIHRLDRETSGILLLARSPEADRAFKRLLEERSLAPAPGVRGAAACARRFDGAPVSGPAVRGALVG